MQQEGRGGIARNLTRQLIDGSDDDLDGIAASWYRLSRTALAPNETRTITIEAALSDFRARSRTETSLGPILEYATST